MVKMRGVVLGVRPHPEELDYLEIRSLRGNKTSTSPEQSFKTINLSVSTKILFTMRYQLYYGKFGAVYLCCSYWELCSEQVGHALVIERGRKQEGVMKKKEEQGEELKSYQ